MKKWVLASNNKGKIKEMQALLAPLDITITPQAELQIPEAEETGLTFVENAILKARQACSYSNLPAIADDSGLEVDVLQGEPGIYSARYAGINASDQDNIDKLLKALENKTQRSARYQCVIVFMQHAKDPTPIIAQGSWEGEILTACRGSSGFGYDPLFYIPSKQCSAAEMNFEEKNAMSHRGQALQLFIEKIKNL